MRKANQQEIQARRQWFVEVSLQRPKKSQKTLGPFVGVTQQEAEQQALAQAQDRWKVEAKCVESYDEFVEDNLFFWDWKVMSAVGNADFAKIDSHIGRFGLEVVTIPFDGTATVWFVSNKLNPERQV